MSSVKERTHECTLVVIDVQDGYDGALKIAPQVRRQVRLAMRLNWNIIFVEYSGNGKTVKEVMQEVTDRNYRYTTVLKYSSDGGKQVLEACEKNSYTKSYLRVCGLYSEYCVHSTVQSLSKSLPESRIEVVTTACYCYSSGFGSVFDWDKNYSYMANVVLILPKQVTAATSAPASPPVSILSQFPCSCPDCLAKEKQAV